MAHSSSVTVVLAAVAVTLVGSTGHGGDAEEVGLGDPVSQPGGAALRPFSKAFNETCDWGCVRSHAAATSSRFAFPAFYVGGAAKCGTTTLASWFSGHPQVLAPLRKEPFFFTQSPARQAATRASYYETLRLDSWWTNGSLATFDGSASYVVHSSATTAPSLFAANPTMKLVLLFREPVTRAVSYLQHTASHVVKAAKRHSVQKGSNSTWADCLAVRSLDACASLGAVAAHLENYGRSVNRWLDVAPKSSFFFATLEDLVSDPAPVFGRMQAFVGLDVFTDLDFDPSGHNRSTDVPYNMSADNYRRLVKKASADADDLDAAVSRTFTKGWRALWRAQAAQCDSPTSGTRGECYIFMNIFTSVDGAKLDRVDLLRRHAGRETPRGPMF